ncbi:RagB/SusD family nutrient uptake outer membrane protein [Galbibacter sp. EGI 63066]|uniref:RagB/SusD family nutrient uptake outer membrane protein n=1 Tax=Galbibacter sp. EGI 63066 TaxID=2993559 RepID=UPI0022490060|nr:RagB/SusD family nutrient uptake outer membrane protein [Galbibacter sp. EGI 63066]MCX2678608.1 RagB/SusD family nutrient uptake outer membrane protein [Galbibacter sp. EGI 63066]
MKRNIKKFSVQLVNIFILIVLSSCSKEFLDRPPEDAYSIDDFYATNEQVAASTNILYNAPWFQFNDTPMWAIGELSSGNGRTWDDNSADFMKFTVTNRKNHISNGWASLWSVVAQANALINFLPDRVGEDVDQSVIDNALGEAHLMRAMAYFYMVRIWGPAPIIENNLDHVYDPKIPTNRVEDVYTFIKNDLMFAADNCFKKVRTSNYADNGHVSSGSAKALLAKVYLYKKDYANARKYAEEVINSGEFKLFGLDVAGSYNDLFLTKNNNNEESIIALQWSNSGEYGQGNALQAMYAFSTTITGTGDGWGAIGPTIDLIESYEEGDARRYGTIMEEGNVYPNLNGGFEVPEDPGTQGTRVAIKKYVVGKPEFNGGGSSQNAPNNTYLLRYADLLLIHAEAVMGGTASTTDPAALASVNKVRERAELPPLTELTKEALLHERRVELAFEGEYFYDLGRIDKAEAIAILSDQERGTYSNDDPPVVWSEKYIPDEDDFMFLYPQVEVQKNPLLLEPPVPYDFN